MILAFWYVLSITCLAEFFVHNMRILIIQRIFPLVNKKIIHLSERSIISKSWAKWSTPVRVRYLRQFTVTSNRCCLPANDVYSDIVKEKKCNVLIKNTLLQVTYTGYDHSPHLHKLPAFWRPAVQICNRGKRFLVRTSSRHGKVNQFLTNGALTGIHEMTITGIFHHASKQGWFSFFFVFQEKVTARSFKYPVDNETCNFLNGGKTKEKRNLEENNKLF